MMGNSSPSSMRKLSVERRGQLREHLLVEIRGPSRRRLARPATTLQRALAKRAGVVAAAALVVAVVSGLLTIGGDADTALAAQVRGKIAEGLEFPRTVRGTFQIRTRDPGQPPRGAPGCLYCVPQVPLPSKFIVAADGSYSSRTIPADAARRRDVAYDAKTGVETSFTTAVDPSDQAIYLRAVNLDPALMDYVPEARLGAWVLGAAGGGDPRVVEATFEGRAVWNLTATFDPGQTLYDAYGARLDAVVDQETGLVLQVTQYAYDTDRWTSIASVRELEIGGSTGAVDFTVPKPPGTIGRLHDYGFHRVQVEAAAATIGYQPLLPSETGGRELIDFAIAKSSDYPFPGLPQRRDVASARYGRGADSITVSTYRGPVADLQSLLPAAESETVHPREGPLVGSVAYVAKPALSAAVFAAFADGLLVRITAPTTQEALAAANSLRVV